MESTLKDWIILNLTPGLGPRLTQQLLKYFKSPRQLISAPDHLLQRLRLSAETVAALKQPNQKSVQLTLEWLQHDQHYCLTWRDVKYPMQLLTLPDPPPLLYVVGNVECLRKPQLAIVGSRRCSETGKELAFEFANALAQVGYVITSGLALGIDAAAHSGCLYAKQSTIAILGNGLLSIYPRGNNKLAEKIIANEGALVSEFPLFSKPTRAHFPQRNRLISGLSLGTLVVEAAQKSGSLITAQLAAEQGREVFALPGSPRNPCSQGCHRLIQVGAKLVQNLEDILDELPKPPKEKPELPQNLSQVSGRSTLDEVHKLLLECVGYEPTSIDQLIVRSELDVNQILSQLLILELKGYIKATPCGYLRVR